jgi:DNA-binding CsgD family transcriptional regulator
MTRDDTGGDVDHGGSITLDKRESIILRALISDGTSTTAAPMLGLSERHTRRLLRSLEGRLGVDNTHALVAVTVAAGLAEPPSPTTVGAPETMQ